MMTHDHRPALAAHRREVRRTAWLGLLALLCAITAVGMAVLLIGGDAR